jgi:hypothetical protein
MASLRPAAQLDPDLETLARPPAKVDDDRVRRIFGKCLQIGRALGRDDLDLLRQRAEMLDCLGGVRRPAD